jgi:hypothetical protein
MFLVCFTLKLQYDCDRMTNIIAQLPSLRSDQRAPSSSPAQTRKRSLAQAQTATETRMVAVKRSSRSALIPSARVLPTTSSVQHTSWPIQTVAVVAAQYPTLRAMQPIDITQVVSNTRQLSRGRVELEPQGLGQT